MAVNGPIIIIDDDHDDIILLEMIFSELNIKNEVRFFKECNAVLSYLLTTTERPFLILSDINQPGMDGVELKQKINENEILRRKAIPFIFFTTTAHKDDVSKAYNMMVQGYFEKPHKLQDIKSALTTIIHYWKLCIHPDSFD